MKKYDHKEACPQCGSRDNVAVWSDGQKYCFGGCGYYIPGNGNLSLADLRLRLEPILDKEQQKNGVISLPFDFTLALPPEPLKWLRSYDVTDEERFKFMLGWSDFYESLIIPAFDKKGKLLLYQKRSFNKAKEPRKYLTRGSREETLWTVAPDDGGLPNDTYNGDLYVVEDAVSSIRVGRQREVSPLWGSSWSLEKLNRVSNKWSRIFIWLDNNKCGEASKMRSEAAVYFDKAVCVITPKDPKAYSDAEIRRICKDAETSSL